MKLYSKACGLCFVLVIFMSSSLHAKSLMNQGVVDAYYSERNGAPVWVKNSRLTRDARDLIAVLEQSWMNGFNPSKYHLNQIHEILSDEGNTHPDSLTMLELLITDAYVEYTRDLSGMRIHASDMGLNSGHWNQRISPQEAISYLDPNKDDIAEFMLMLEPQTITYQRLKAQLVSLVEKAGEVEQQEPITFSHSVVRPGRGYDAIPKLRQRLGLDAVDGADQYKYDDNLFQAVKYFQEKKGLKPDGLIGKQTLFALNQTHEQKIQQIIVNMERLRWVPEKKPDRFILVNIPSFTLWAVEDGKVAFEMPIIVGRKKRPTLSFVSNIHGVRFNPTWTVPKTIKREDILPHLQEDPNYLTGKGMELYDGYGTDAITLDPTSVDWHEITLQELYSLNMVQGPGANNPLGSIRVLMPNPHNIYLHDTNHKSLFARTNRAQSSGCVRMKNPEKVADFIMKAKPNWSKQKMEDILNKGEMKDIYTSEKMPVYILYQTVWIGSENQIVYGNDIYSYDKKLLQLLEKLDEIPKISNSETSLTLAYQ